MTRAPNQTQAFSLREKVGLHRHIVRKWMGSLPGAQFQIVMFIFTNTIEWGKAGDRFKLDHFVNGIGSAPAIPASKMTIRRALQSLVERGVLSRDRTQYGYRYYINFDWEPDGLRHGNAKPRRD